PIVQIGALVVLLIFTGFVIGQSLQWLGWPSLDFLAQSRDLDKDPAIQALQQAVVQVEVLSTGLATPTRYGTGFNIAATGLIVTNAHVIAGAKSITVSFPNAGLFRAVDWSSLPADDLAVIRLEHATADLPVATIRPLTAGPLQTGEPVL